MPQSRSVAATDQGIAKIKARMAELQKPIPEGKTGKSCWTQEYLATQAHVSLDTVKRFLRGTAIDEGYAIAIVKALNLELADIVNLPKPEPEPIQPDDINWHQICQSRLDAYEERFFKNNPLTGINFYVPLGLVEPKREQQKRQKQEVNPEDGSQFYQLAETEITKTYSEPNQFFEEVLRQGNSKTKGQRLAVIGEPGAGKTTLLYQIARWILQENLGYPILIRLADVNKPIRDYLTQNWLRDAMGSLTEVSPEWVAAFEGLMRPLPNPPLRGEGTGKNGGTNSPRLAGEGSGERSKQVWLLLDAVDEMGITSPLASINQQLAEGWTQRLRVVLTCRLNVWEGEKNALGDFDVYRNLDFNSQQIQDFIEQWFNDASESQELLKQLKEPNQTRINDLIKNPLRLALLCRTWKRGQKLPETQAGLYQRLVTGHYQWKDDQKPFQIPLEVQKRLHQQLGELAKTAINREQFRFRLEEKFVEQYLGKPQQENSLFDWALKLGWLNRLGLASVEEKDSDQAVYAFFHPSFQEYFAALAINDWDYFLPRNHVNCPEEGKEYRIFQPQWKQVILLWLGRDDMDKGEKEEFIQKLVSFDDGCGKWNYIRVDRGFYEYRAYYLAADGINEFKECTFSDKIVEQIVKFRFGYWYIKKGEWVTFIDKIEEGVKIVSSNTIVEKARANIIQILEIGLAIDEDENTRWMFAAKLCKIDPRNELLIRFIRELIRILETTKDQDQDYVVHILGEIAVGNELAIQALIRLLDTYKPKWNRWRVAESLRKIAVGNELAIQALIRFLETTEDEYARRKVAKSLGEIAVGNELAIGALIRLLETTEDEITRREVAEGLEKVEPGNELTIGALIRFLETTEDEYTRRAVTESLGKVEPGNELAIKALIQLLESTEDEYTRKKVAESLGKIAVGNELEMKALIQILKTTEDEYTRREVAKILREISVGNELVIGELIQVFKTSEYKYTHCEIAKILGEIAVENELAIQALIRFLETTEDEYTRSTFAESLGEIAVGNELAIQALIRLLQTTEDEYTRSTFAESLGKIAVENELAIQALIRLLQTTENEYARKKVAESLGKIDPGNELAIQTLIRLLQTTEDEFTRLIVAQSLGKIAVRNELAIQTLIQLLKTTEDESTRRSVAESLGKIIKTEKQYTDVVLAIKNNLNDEVYNNNFNLYKNCYKLLWQCAENLPYPKFYQAWHYNSFTATPKTRICHFLKRRISEILRFTAFRSG